MIKEQTSLYGRVLSGFVWEASTKLIIQVSSWASTILVARLLDPSDYGLVAISGIFTGICLLVGGMGLSAGLIQSSELNQRKIKSIFSLGLYLNLLLILILNLSAPLIASLYDNSELESIIRVASLVLLFSSLSLVPQAMRIKQLDFRFISLAEMASSFVTTASVLVMAYSGYGVWSLVISVVLGQFCLFLLYLPGLFRYFSLSFLWKDSSDLVKFGLTYMGSGVLTYLNERTGVFIASVTWSESKVGLYQFSYSLAQMPVEKLGKLFNRVGYPSFSKVKDHRQELVNLFLNLHNYLILITFPVFIAFAVLAEDVVRLLLTEKWLPMAPYLQMLSILGLFKISEKLLPRIFESLGKPQIVFRYNVISLLIIVVGMAVGAQFSLFNMIAAVVLIYPFLYSYLVWRILRELELSLLNFLRSMRKTCVILLGFSISIVLMSFINIEEALFNVVGTLAVGASVYCLLFYALMRGDITKIRSLLVKSDAQ